MFIVKFHGGLGNQLFQLSLYKKLLKDYGIENVFGYRQNFNELIVNHNYLNILKFFIKKSKREYYKTRKGQTEILQGQTNINFIESNQINFDKVIIIEDSKLKSDIFRKSKDYFFDGYWQNQFPDENTIIAKKTHHFLQSYFEKNKKTSKISHKISTLNSVSIHIRRGDYVSNLTSKNIYNTCGLDYFWRAIDVIRNKIQNPHFFVFSDDLSYAIDNFRAHDIEIVSLQTKNKTYSDLLLMSTCRHNVISNSTYSWWAAKMNNNPDKIILMPKWWQKEKLSKDLNLVEKGWIEIDNNSENSLLQENINEI